MTPLALDINAAAAALALSRSKLYILIGEGKIKVRKSGRRTLIEVSELTRFLQELPTSGQGQG